MNRDKYLLGKIGVPYTAEFISWIEGTPWYWFGMIWDWANEQDWWEDFLQETWRELSNHRQQDRVLDMQMGVRMELINPQRFADDIYNFLQRREV